MIEPFKAEMRRHGLETSDPIIPNGTLHRIHIIGDESGSKNGWYVLHFDGVAAGAFGSWKTGESHTWCAESQNKMTALEHNQYRQKIEQAKRQREAEQNKVHTEAREKTASILATCRPATDDHAYLVAKGIKSHGVKVYEGSLVVPLCDTNNTVHSLQFIRPNGEKRFLSGGRISGCYYLIGNPISELYICEGFATGSSIHEATNKAVAIVFNAGNLKPTGRSLRKKYPNVCLIICADNDQWTEGNPGITKARETATAVGCAVVIPQFKDTSARYTDFNDLCKSEGPEVVRQQMEAAESTEPEPRERAGAVCKIPLVDNEGKKKSQSTILIELTDECVNLFHDKEQVGYAIFEVRTHKECWPIRTKGFKDWLKHQYFRLSGRGVGNQGLQDAIDTIEAKALFDNLETPVYRRIANLGDKIVFDIGDKEWRAVEVTENRWRIMQSHPVHFVRTTTMLPLSEPEAGGDINDLKKFINIEERDFPLIIGWLLMAMRGRGPYPVLLLQGEQGTGKSTTTRNIRSLVDPVTVPIKTLPKKDHDLTVIAHNNAIVALDNLSGVNKSMSDTLCGIATGTGSGSRKLYTNLEEESTNIIRPIILNGIDDIATRGDLLQRSLILELPTIDEENRAYELDMNSDFESAKPKLFGALLSALSAAIRNEATTVLSYRPRMADFARWVTSAETGLSWKSGHFIECYRQNIDQAVESTLEASPVGVAIREMMESHSSWDGTATALKGKLESVIGESINKKAWPQSPRGLTNALKRIAPALRKVGIQYTKTRGTDKNRTKLIKLDWVGKVRSARSVGSEVDNSKGNNTDPKRTERTKGGPKADRTAFCTVRRETHA